MAITLDGFGVFAHASFVGDAVIAPDFAGTPLFGLQPSPLPEVAKARSPRREQRERIAKGLAVVKAAKKKGLEVKSATIEGIVLDFGESVTASGTNVGNNSNEWDRDLG